MKQSKREEWAGTCTHNGDHFIYLLVLPLPNSTDQVIARRRAAEHSFHFLHIHFTPTPLLCVSTSSWCGSHRLFSMAFTGGIKCLKYLMFAFNFFFWVGALYSSSSILLLCQCVRVRGREISSKGGKTSS